MKYIRKCLGITQNENLHSLYSSIERYLTQMGIKLNESLPINSYPYDLTGNVTVSLDPFIFTKLSEQSIYIIDSVVSILSLNISPPKFQTIKNLPLNYKGNSLLVDLIADEENKNLFRIQRRIKRQYPALKSFKNIGEFYKSGDVSDKYSIRHKE